MSKEKHQDRLIDMLLREELGTEDPPDLTVQILSQLPKPVMIWQRPWAWAALISMILAVLIVWHVRFGYPSPSAGGAYQVADGGSVRRSAVLTTASDKAEVVLGGYCSVEMEPASRLRIDGGKWEEAVYLMRGEVTCDVDRRMGTFDVVTDAGTVSVTGTKFSVRVKEKQVGEQDMKNATTTLLLVVAVTTGSVTVDYKGKTYEIGAGTQKVFGEERKPYFDPGGKGLDWSKVKGFSGQVRGVVKGIGDDGHIKYRVARVLKTWKGNKARTPQALVGQDLRIGPRRENHKTGTGKPVHRHVAYIRTLKKGAEITLEIYNPKGKEWHILELNGDQREIADRLMRKHEEREGEEREKREKHREEIRRDREEREKRERHEYERKREHKEREKRHREELEREERDKPAIEILDDEPEGEEWEEAGERRDGERERDREEKEEGQPLEGMHGFKGMLEGKIVKKNRDHFVLKIERVKKVWEGSKARNPKGAVGREIEIDFAMKNRHTKKHLTTYRKLRAGDRVFVGAFHNGGKRLSIAEGFERIR